MTNKIIKTFLYETYTILFVSDFIYIYIFIYNILYECSKDTNRKEDYCNVEH